MEGSVFPPDIAPTRFHWSDSTKTVDRWTVEIAFNKGAPIRLTSDVPEWTPPTDVWARIKQHSTEAAAPGGVFVIGQPAEFQTQKKAEPKKPEN